MVIGKSFFFKSYSLVQVIVKDTCFLRGCLIPLIHGYQVLWG